MPRLARTYYLGISPIHGIGVFAARDLPPGARLGRIHTIPLGHVEELASLPTTGLILKEGNALTIHAVDAGFPYWYLNYSRESNVMLGGRSEIVATRLILRHDELTMPFLNVGEMTP